MLHYRWSQPKSGAFAPHPAGWGGGSECPLPNDLGPAYHAIRRRMTCRLLARLPDAHRNQAGNVICDRTYIQRVFSRSLELRLDYNCLAWFCSESFDGERLSMIE
jgi:hypothetical protein